MPEDDANRRLGENVHPTAWVNPIPTGRYNIVVVGAGTAGLVCAAGAAGLGARVALIERDFMGGDCLNFGCVPSKALLGAAHAAGRARRAGDVGVGTGEVTVDFAAVMSRMREIRADISRHDSASRFNELGVDVFIGEGRFTGQDTIAVGNQTLRFSKAVIATGARAAAPAIPGLDTVDYLTNETLFALTELPSRFGIIGAGPIGCEMAQAFARFGSQVCLLEAMDEVLPNEEPQAGALVHAALKRDGVAVITAVKNLHVEKCDNGIRLVFATDVEKEVAVDQLLVAVGRTPNLESLNLEAARVSFHKKGVEVDDYLRTTNSRIYAAGDICSRFQFTHAADFMARIVIQNALFRGRAKASALTIPWCTYTDPEVAHVGITPRDAQARGIAIDTYTQPFSEVDRALLDGASEGYVRVYTRKGSDRILGATIAGEHAGDMIPEIVFAMTHGFGLGKIASTIHPYPTRAEAIRRIGDQYNRTRLTPLLKKLFKKWLEWSR